MKKSIITLLPTVFLLLTPMQELFAADDGNWKRGRIYYRMVCTACHKAMTGKSISPVTKTIAEWKAYIDADKHDASGKSNPSLKYYVSTEYRESIKDKNKVAKKLLKIPDAEMLADVRAFAIHGAKDSDTPARCQ